MRGSKGIGLNLSSIVVHARPGARSDVCSRLAAIEGVEVHVASPDGRLVATIERADAGATTRTYEAIERTEGVLSVALVYQYDDASEPNTEDAA